MVAVLPPHSLLPRCVLHAKQKLDPEHGLIMIDVVLQRSREGTVAWPAIAIGSVALTT